jgi:hypothetical protein
MSRERRAELVRQVVVQAIRKTSARAVAKQLPGVSHTSVANFATGKVQLPDERTLFRYEQWADEHFGGWRDRTRDEVRQGDFAPEVIASVAARSGHGQRRASLAAADRLLHALNLAVMEGEITANAAVETAWVLRERFPEVELIVWDSWIARHTKEGTDAGAGGSHAGSHAD